MRDEKTFRVVGVRVDGSKRILCDNISSGEIAERVAVQMAGCGIFQQVIVESEEEPMFDPKLSWRMNLD